MFRSTKSRRGLAIAISLSIVLGLFLPGIASAREQSYGPWFNLNGEMQYGMTPFNSSKTSELTTFQCMLPNGEPLTDARKEMITDIVKSATLVFTNKLDPSFFKDGELQYVGSNNSETELDPAGSEPGASTEEQIAADPRNESYLNAERNNLGYPPGAVGMELWLFQIERMLKKNNHENGFAKMAGIRVGIPESFVEKVDWSQTSRGRGSTPGLEYSYDVISEEVASDSDSKVVAGLINYKANFPHEIANKLPPGCSIAPFSPPSDLSFSDIIDDFGGTILNMILILPEMATSELYQEVAPAAWKFLLMTGHYERGDPFLGWATTCVPAENATRTDIKQIQDTCTGVGPKATPLGYSKKNLKVERSEIWYMKISSFLSWLISGFYFMIIFAAAIMFILRGNRNTQFNVISLIPRLILSILLTLLAPWIIGAMISFSNQVVQVIFTSEDAHTITTIDILLSQSGIILSGGELFQRLFTLIVGMVSIVAFVMMIIYSIIRHALLIVLLVIAPIAIFCIITDKWRPNFQKWLRAVLAVIFIPVILALVLKVGISINPLIMSPESSYGTMLGMFGIIMLVAILIALWRILKSMKDFAIGQSSAASGAAGGAGSAIRSRTSGQGGMLAAAGAGAAGLLGSGAGGRSLIPPGRESGNTPGGGAGPGFGGGGGAAPGSNGRAGAEAAAPSTSNALQSFMLARRARKQSKEDGSFVGLRERIGNKREQLRNDIGSNIGRAQSLAEAAQGAADQSGARFDAAAERGRRFQSAAGERFGSARARASKRVAQGRAMYSKADELNIVPGAKIRAGTRQGAQASVAKLSAAKQRASELGAETASQFRAAASGAGAGARAKGNRIGAAIGASASAGGRVFGAVQTAGSVASGAARDTASTVVGGARDAAGSVRSTVVGGVQASAAREIIAAGRAAGNDR